MAIDEAGFVAHRGPPLTVSHLRLWVENPRISPHEWQDRATLANMLYSAARGGNAAGELVALEQVNIANFEHLTELPPGLHSQALVVIERCPALRRLGQGMRVGTLKIGHCHSLSRLPNDTVVEGVLNIWDCIGLHDIPPSVSVNSSIYLSDCPNLESFAWREVKGDLEIRACPSLSFECEELTVHDNLGVYNCASVEALPAKLRVLGNLEVQECDNLTALPEALDMPSGSLSILYTPITSLSAREIHGDLYLDNCDMLFSLPENMVVHGDLTLSCCDEFDVLPRNATVHGTLYIDGCQSLERIPASVCDWGMEAISLNGLSLDESDLYLLRDLAPEGLSIRLDGESLISDETPVNLEETLENWAEEVPLQRLRRIAVTQEQVDSWQLRKPDARNLLKYLRRLSETSDYENEATRPYLAVRVMTMLGAMHSHATFRDLLLRDVDNAVHTCGDRVILQMNAIEQHIKVFEATQGALAESKLRDLGVGFLAVDIAREHAMAKRRANPRGDHIGVDLRFETGVPERLLQRNNPLATRVAQAWPLSTRGMTFASSADVEDSEIDAACDAILAAVRDPERMEAHFAAWDPWQVHTRRQDAAAHTFRGAALKKLPADEDLDEDSLMSEQVFSESRTFQELIDDASAEPVYIDKGSNHVYERRALLQWWVTEGIDPMTRTPFTLDDLRRPR